MKATFSLIALSALALSFHQEQDPPMPDPTPAVQVFQMEALLEKHRAGERAYSTFLQVSALHAGIYTLGARAVDSQGAHGEDEIYYVLKGRAKLRSKTPDRDVRPGSVIYVKAGEEHRFTEITEDLELLVLFSTGPTDPPKQEAGGR